MVNNVLTLTDSNYNVARSTFYNIPQNIGSFAAHFTYQPSSLGLIADGADGITFTLQNVGPYAIGNAGGDLGYGGL